MRKYRTPIVSRVPFIKRKTVMDRTPTIMRNPIVTRNPVPSEWVKFDSCPLGCGSCFHSCDGNEFCDYSEVGNPEVFRLIRIEDKQYTDEDWLEIVDAIRITKSQDCYIRMIVDIPVPKEILFELAYSPYNTIQFNVNLFCDNNFFHKMKANISTADNCGLYIALMLFPVIPVTTKTYDIIELLSSMRCTCNNICFKFLELDINTKKMRGCYNVNGNLVPSEYMEMRDGKLKCSEFFQETFCTIMMQYTTPRKINCSLCNDCICY